MGSVALITIRAELQLLLPCWLSHRVQCNQTLYLTVSELALSCASSYPVNLPLPMLDKAVHGT